MGSPASIVTAAMPARVAAERSERSRSFEWSTAMAPKPFVMARIRGFERSARSWGRLVRWNEPVWRSTR
jgi:hypothetical protein